MTTLIRPTDNTRLSTIPGSDEMQPVFLMPRAMLPLHNSLVADAPQQETTVPVLNLEPKNDAEPQVNVLHSQIESPAVGSPDEVEIDSMQMFENNRLHRLSPQKLVQI